MRLTTFAAVVFVSGALAAGVEAQGGKRGGPPPRVAGAGIGKAQAARPKAPKAPSPAGQAKGRPAHAAAPGQAGKPDGVGRPEHAGKPGTPGRPEHAGKPSDVGRPDHAGPPEHAGRPEDAGPPDHAGRPEHAGPPEHAGQGNGEGRRSIADHLDAAPQLRDRLAERLPAGVSVEQAAAGFDSFGRFVAAVNVSHNLDIPFDQLKARVTGDNRVPLGQAIQKLRPDADGPAVAAQAERDARALVAAAGGQ